MGNVEAKKLKEQSFSSLCIIANCLQDTCILVANEKCLALFDYKTQECLRNVIAHDDVITCLKPIFWQTKECVLTGSKDGHVKMWDITNGDALSTFMGNLWKMDGVYYIRPVQDIAHFHSFNQELFVVIALSNEICIWNYTREEKQYTITATETIWQIDVLYSKCLEDPLCLLINGATTFDFSGKEQKYNNVPSACHVFVIDHLYFIALGHNDGRLEIYCLPWKKIFEIKEPANIKMVCFYKRENVIYLFSAGSDKKIRLYNFQTRFLEATIHIEACIDHLIVMDNHIFYHANNRICSAPIDFPPSADPIIPYNLTTST